MAAITGTLMAWITSNYTSPADLLKENGVTRLQFSRVDTDMSDLGWVRAGTAEVTVELLSEEDMFASKIEALRAEAKAIQAKATAQTTAIQSRINDLLAIGHSPADHDVVDAGFDPDFQEVELKS